MASSVLQCPCSSSSSAGPLSSGFSARAFASSSPKSSPLRLPCALGGRLHLRRSRHFLVSAVAAPPRRPPALAVEEDGGQLPEIYIQPFLKGSDAFSAAAPPPFTLADIRAAIPKHCWVKDPWKSFGYVVRDVVAVFGLAAGAAYLNNWLVWPLYWLAQGTMFWALFVLGHDCGHGSFSNNKMLNNVVGHLIHSSILVPYHGWRISHRTHHQNHGHVEKDESWHPFGKKLYSGLDQVTRLARFSALSMLAYPVYLWGRSPGKKGSHFDPSSSLFNPSERNEVSTSTVCWSSMAAVLVGLTFVLGPMWMFKLYAVPYLVFVIWIDAVTYLHHHGYDEKIPWYRGKGWTYLRGGLSTIDRDYGWINNIHHDIGTHVVHHLFPQIPHYHLIEATKAVKPVFGKYYREPEKSQPLPLHLWKVLAKSFGEDHYVPDEGDVVFYQKDVKGKAS